MMFNFAAWETLVIASLVTVTYSMLGGLQGVLITDFVQFIIAMVGSVWASIYIVNLGRKNKKVTRKEIANFISVVNNSEFKPKVIGIVNIHIVQPPSSTSGCVTSHICNIG